MESPQNIENYISDLSLFLEDYNYLQLDLSNTTRTISRFKLSEFIDKLDKILEENNEEEIERIFLDENYSELRDMWGRQPEKKETFTIEHKKQYLNHFKAFLILYN